VGFIRGEISPFTPDGLLPCVARWKEDEDGFGVLDRRRVIQYGYNSAYSLFSHRDLSVNPEVELKSDVRMDYSKLRDLLKAGRWKEADEETFRVMLAVAKREKEGWLDTESIDNFPCADLRTIDQLWVKYSNGKFGFYVQKTIYQGLGGTRKYNSDIGEKFGDKVGWRKVGSWLYYKDITFDIKAPKGHLPVWGMGWWNDHRWLEGTSTSLGVPVEDSSIFCRIETCRL
jgi:hypothetical protein